jgi:hypothetical protein
LLNLRPIWFGLDRALLEVTPFPSYFLVDGQPPGSRIVLKRGWLRRTMRSMKRVVILGRGASGKSTLAKRLGEITGLPVVELVRFFWQPGLVATPRNEWACAQDLLVANEGWIMDGDLGPLDDIESRLRAADTVIFLDFSFARCAWRALRRSRERFDFWWWVLAYRWQSRPALMEAIVDCAPTAELYILRAPKAVKRFVDSLAQKV